MKNLLKLGLLLSLISCSSSRNEETEQPPKPGIQQAPGEFSILPSQRHDLGDGLWTLANGEIHFMTYRPVIIWEWPSMREIDIVPGPLRIVDKGSTMQLSPYCGEMNDFGIYEGSGWFLIGNRMFEVVE